MIIVEPTSDYPLVRKILTLPWVWHRMKDDYTGEPHDFQLPEENAVLRYVVARDGAEPLGVFVLVHRSPVLCEVHFCFLPEAFGDRARAASKLFLAWLWTHTEYRRAVGNIPASNPLALRFARSFGFKAWGRNPKAIQRHGKLIDEIWVGISRPEIPC